MRKHSLVLIIFLMCIQSVAVVWPLFGKEVASGHDIAPHLVRLQLFSQALNEGQFPVRWVDWGRSGTGHPLFLFYPPLLYYGAVIFVQLGMGFHHALGMVMLVATLLASSGWVLLGRLYRSTWSGVAAAVVFTWLPYRLSQLYVRAAFPEYLALSLLPWVVVGMEWIAKGKRAQGVVTLAGATAGMMVAHQPTVFMTILPLLFLMGWIIWRERQLQMIGHMVVGGILGFSLAAFFVLPSIVERGMIRPELLQTGYYEFHQHFVTVPQLMLPVWEYGISQAGPNDGMSFQVGFVTIALVLVGLWLIWRKHFHLSIGVAIVIYGMWASTLTSLPLWEYLPVFGFIQYPWRFLSMVVFGAALIALWSMRQLTRRLLNLEEAGWVPVSVLVFSIIVVAISWGYRHPSRYLSVEQFALAATYSQPPQVFGLEEGYLPRSLVGIDVLRPFTTVTQGDATVSVQRQTMHQLVLRVEAQQPSKLRIQIPFYPGWKAWIRQSNAMQLGVVSTDSTGYMLLDLPAGSYDLTLVFGRTPLREVADVLTLVSLLGLMGWGCWQGKQRWSAKRNVRVVRSK